MNLFYVCQNQTRKQESEGQYLWSPQKTKNGSNNAGYMNMQLVKKGDLIFHGANQMTYAVSIAQNDCYPSKQPTEIKEASKETIWSNEGYRVDTTYFIASIPLDMRPHYTWLATHKRNSAFTKNGACKQIYLNQLHLDHAKYLLQRLLDLKQEDFIQKKYQELLAILHSEEEQDYSLDEIAAIHHAILEGNWGQATWTNCPEPKEFVSAPNSNKKIPKRDPRKALIALSRAEYSCEYDRNDRVFLRSNGRANYTEPHHLIPLCRHEDFENNLDMPENIVSLCSHCHNLLHYGRYQDKLAILKTLYKKRKDALKSVGLELQTINDLLKYYE